MSTPTPAAVDAPRPGEIDLDTGAFTPPDPEPVVAEDAAEEPVVEEPAAGDPPAVVAPAARAKNGMLEELIEHRTIRRDLEKQMGQLQPVLSRLTPELQQAIAEGRIMVKPTAAPGEARQAQLETTARKLDLFRDDGQGNRVPDIDAAAKVDTYVREVAQEAVAPFRESTVQQQAQHNLNVALTFAQENGYDVETVRETFASAPPGMVADPDLAKVLWRQAMGLAVERGKLPTGKPAPAAAARRGPAAVVTEPTGRRGPSAGITLSPALANVYKSHGIDPGKAFTATNKVDFTGAIELE